MTLVRTFPYEGTDFIEGAEQGEVEYALTRSQWESRSARWRSLMRQRCSGSEYRGRGQR